MTARIGGLCFGYGGLDLAVQQVIPDAELAWYAEFDKGASKIGAHRFPGVPNHGDMTAIDWSAVEPVDILTGGTPCQDLSHAGKRAGMTEGTRSNLWVAMRDAIATIKPSLVVWENVGGAYSAEATSELEPCPGCVGDGPGVHLRALGRVLGDLASLGFDAEWRGLRAADVGAPHGRLRVFVVAWPADTAGHARRVDHGDVRDAAANPSGLRRGTWWPTGPREAARGWAPADVAGRGDAPVSLLGTPTARDGKGSGQGERLLESARRGQVEAQVVLLSEGGEDLVGDGVAGGVLASVDLNKGAEVFGGFGAQGDRHAATLAPESQADLTLLPTPAVNDMGKAYTPETWDAWCAEQQAKHGNGNGHGKSLEIEAQRLLPTPRTENNENRQSEGYGGKDGNFYGLVNGLTDWGDYAPAIRRWEHLTRPAPDPTETGTKGSPRLSARFSEWMMGLPDGWVTDVPGITRNEALKALGNGVVPQQAAAAIDDCLRAAAREVAA